MDIPEVDIKVCMNCHSVFARNRWQQIPLRKLVIDELSVKSKDVRISRIREKDLLEIIKNKQKRAELSITAAKAGKKKKLPLVLKIQYKQCTTCSRAKSGYYEGILQLRNKRNPDFDKILEETMDQVKRDKHGFIAKSAEIKDGVDLYLSSKKLLQAIGKKLYLKYGGTMTMSQSLFSRDRQSSKNVYRVTVLVRLPDFKRGDIVFIKKRPVLVRSIKKDMILGIDITKHKRATGRMQDVHQVLPSEDFTLAKVTKTRPQLEVLHPETFQSTPVENPIPIKKENINVIEIKGKLYLVPAD